MKNLFRLLFPNTKRYPSDINGTLEVTYYRGEKILNTKNANYASGSFQEILSFGFSKVDLSNVNSILILGLGGGSGIKALRNTFNYTKNIVVVELDPKIIQIANEEFDIQESDNLQIIQADAFDYVKKCKEKFQLVLIDIFIDFNVPKVFYSKEFCRLLPPIIERNGSFIFNLGMGLNKDSEIVKSTYYHLQNTFDLQLYQKNIGAGNSLLIGKKKKK